MSASDLGVLVGHCGDQASTLHGSRGFEWARVWEGPQVLGWHRPGRNREVLGWVQALAGHRRGGAIYGPEVQGSRPGVDL